MKKIKKIENLEQYKLIENEITKLLELVNDNTPITDANYLKLEECSKLIEEYDDIHYKIEKPSLVEVLQLRMYERRLTQRDIAKLINVSPSRVSDFMNGRSMPTLEIARRMHTNLDIQPAVFFR